MDAYARMARDAAKGGSPPARSGPEPAAGAEPAAMKTTPAGGQINASWGQLDEAIDCFAVFLAGAAGDASQPRARGQVSFVIFRCGTVARVADADPEFRGYEGSQYSFPQHRAEDASVVADVLADNAKVWAAQRALPGAAGKAVRQGYEKLVSQGYPYPGGPPADRSPVPTGLASDAEGPFWLVCWPNLDEQGHVHNLAFSRSGAMAAAGVGGELRRYDYMFPEVAAVITPDLCLWAYDAGGRFGPLGAR